MNVEFVSVQSFCADAKFAFTRHGWSSAFGPCRIVNQRFFNRLRTLNYQECLSVVAGKRMLKKFQAFRFGTRLGKQGVLI